MLNLYRSSSLRGPSDKEISQPAGHVLHVRDRFWGHTNTNTPNSIFHPVSFVQAMCLMGCIQPGRTFTPCLLHRDDLPFTAREREMPMAMFGCDTVSQLYTCADMLPIIGFCWCSARHMWPKSPEDTHCAGSEITLCKFQFTNTQAVNHTYCI